MPYFPYSRQSKKKSHRGAITARMIANLLHIAGVNHVITIDLHSSQMQGFFKCPVDNLVAEPLLANWIRRNVPDWKRGVVVSKNPGGTRRVTSLADALEIDFAIVTTDRRRPASYNGSLDGNQSIVFERLEQARAEQLQDSDDKDDDIGKDKEQKEKEEISAEDHAAQHNETEKSPLSPRNHLNRMRAASNDLRRRTHTPRDGPSSPLVKSVRSGDSPIIPGTPISRAQTAAASEHDLENEYTDEVCV
jgi:ribose-phosphate pyrophosphokinase